VVRPLTYDQAELFLKKWHDVTYTAAENEIRENREARLLDAIKNNRNVRELAKNPLLLTMTAIVNRGPVLSTRQLELYQGCSKLLIARWNWTGKEPLPATDPRSLANQVEYRHKEEILRNLAWHMQEDASTLTPIVDRDVLSQVIAAVVKTPYEGIAPITTNQRIGSVIGRTSRYSLLLG